MDLGVDFGSTYTTISQYREATEQLQDISLFEGTPFIPTVVSEGKGKLQFGAGAKVKTGKKGFRTFKAFKMLLPETNEKVLEERGFDEEHRPDKIAEQFLEDFGNYCEGKPLKHLVDRTRGY